MPGRIPLFYSLHFPLGYNTPNVPKVHLGVYLSVYKTLLVLLCASQLRLP